MLSVTLKIVFMCVYKIKLNLFLPPSPNLTESLGKRSRRTSIHHAVRYRPHPWDLFQVVGCPTDSQQTAGSAVCGTRRDSILRNTLTDLIGSCKN